MAVHTSNDLTAPTSFDYCGRQPSNLPLLCRTCIVRDRAASVDSHPPGSIVPPFFDVRRGRQPINTTE